jgi:predicted phage baseplate assembly protein
MSFPLPNLDDRTAQDLVDWAKRDLIPRYCPEWTDHNVSDPGIALIEVFAAMTEMLLYRVNQIPDRLQLRLMELMGMRLKGPQAAVAPITFYLTAPQPVDTTMTIDAGVAVATERTEHGAEILFTTREPLHIRGLKTVARLTEHVSRADASRWTRHERPYLPIKLFPDDPQTGQAPTPGDAFYLGLAEDPGRHVVHVVIVCEREAVPQGLDPGNPPLQWQALCRRDEHTVAWVDCTNPAHEPEAHPDDGVTHTSTGQRYDDTSGGFSRSGKMRLYLPSQMVKQTLEGTTAYWVRCVLTQPFPKSRYGRSPEVSRIDVEAWGGTVWAWHATAVHDEELGVSDGTPGQQLHLRHTPLLERDSDHDLLVVEHNGTSQPWQEVRDFSQSGPDDGHYTLDPVDGVVTCGPALLQPDGTLLRYGAIPPRGSRLRFRRYHYGGGRQGNVAAHALRVLKHPRAYIKEVCNHTRAQGGIDAERIPDAAIRAPQYMRHRTRAITAQDYEDLACEIPAVARAFCYAPENQQRTPSYPSGAHAPRPGEVVLVILPQSQLVLTDALRRQVLQKLHPVRPLGITLHVAQPTFYAITVASTIHLPSDYSQQRQDALRARIQAALASYVNPYCGGPHRLRRTGMPDHGVADQEHARARCRAEGLGWPFGRALHIAEIYSVIQPLLDAETIDTVQIFHLPDPAAPQQRRAVNKQLDLVTDGLIYSCEHTVLFRF